MLRSSATLRLVFVFTAILAALVAGSSEGAERKPNLVLIFADDLGWRDVGYQSDGAFLTPHIDRLAAGGMVFTDAYATAGNCAPSRACLLSGTYTPRHHVYAVGSTDRGPDNLKRLVPVPNKSGLPKEVVTLAEALKAAGYATGHFGKWHLAGPDGAKPSEQGFDATYDSFGDGEVKEGSEGNKKGPPEDPKGVFTLTRKACDFMEANKDRPFFVYLPHHAIHGPLQMRPETAALMAKEGAKSKVSASYRGCTYDMDASVGMLLEKLKALGLEKDTLVVFTSDNGATPGSPQEPLRGNKGCYYEGGIREPFIASWPGVIEAGAKCGVPISNVDLYPTFLAAAGAAAPEGKVLDGESLLPLLRGEGDWPERTLGVHSQRIDFPERWRKSAMMTQQWRLINGEELYDVQGDPSQERDVSGDHPEVKDALRQAYDAWWNHIDERFDEYVAIPIGQGPEATRITAHDWHPADEQDSSVPWNQPAIMRNPVTNGHWVIEVPVAGQYELELYQWDKPAEKTLDAISARAQVGDVKAEANVPAGATSVKLQMELPAGQTKMQTWLHAKDGTERGAFFVYAKKL